MKIATRLRLGGFSFAGNLPLSKSMFVKKRTEAFFGVYRAFFAYS